jgi:hypothetical protein
MSWAARSTGRRFADTIFRVALLGGLATVPLPAQQASPSCGLLQVAEVEAAIGGKASGKPTGSKQAVPGMTVDECAIQLSGPNHPVGVRVVSNLGMDGAEAITIRNKGTAREQQWTVKGARLEQTTVGKAICILTGRPSVASHSVCSIPRGQGYVEVEVIGDVDNLPTLATVAALVQKANSRL